MMYYYMQQVTKKLLTENRESAGAILKIIPEKHCDIIHNLKLLLELIMYKLAFGFVFVAISYT